MIAIHEIMTLPETEDAAPERTVGSGSVVVAGLITLITGVVEQNASINRSRKHNIE